MINLENYKKEELTIQTSKAQLNSILYILPILLTFGFSYFLLWKKSLTIEHYKTTIIVFGQWLTVIILGSMILGIILHELIHGLTWSIFAKNGLKSMKYGVIWEWLTPYCHCEEPLLNKDYIIGAIMPALLLGIVPSLLALLTGSLALIIFGLFFTLSAGGDFMILNILRKEPMNSLVQDHPKKIGCYIYRPLI